ncbi:MAG: hypothetical protein VKL59_20845 [Nostocaceae cyanobacterium]|nr:hypothetical protein [Nostocaceae cyanobacterium]
MSKSKFYRRLSAFYAPRVQASPTAVNYLIFRNARKKSIVEPQLPVLVGKFLPFIKI